MRSSFQDLVVISMLFSTRLLINPDDRTVFSSNPDLAEKDILLLTAWPRATLFPSWSQGVSPQCREETSAEPGFLFPCTTQSFTLMRTGFQLLHNQNEDSRRKLLARLSSNLHLILDEVSLLLFSLELALFQCCFRVSSVPLLCCGFVP